IGSVMTPSSWIWQTISFASYQIFRLPGDLACLIVLAATSLTASVRSMARASVSPAWTAYRCTTARIAARSVVYEYDIGSSGSGEGSEGTGAPPSGRGTGSRVGAWSPAGSRRVILPSQAISRHDTPARETLRRDVPRCAE